MAESATSVGSLTFLGLFAMFSLSPRFTFCASRESLARTPVAKPEAGIMPERRDSAAVGPLVRCHPETSYWLGDANEMPAINTILIIVNSAARESLSVPQNSCAGGKLGQLFVKNKANLRQVRNTFR